jgi:hypothetical protein
VSRSRQNSNLNWIRIILQIINRDGKRKGILNNKTDCGPKPGRRPSLALQPPPSPSLRRSPVRPSRSRPARPRVKQPRPSARRRPRPSSSHARNQPRFFPIGLIQTSADSSPPIRGLEKGKMHGGVARAHEKSPSAAKQKAAECYDTR